MGDLECWICDGDPEVEVSQLLFDMEFDTFYHPECLEAEGCETILEFEQERERPDIEIQEDYLG